MGWRVSVFDALTGDVIDWDAPAETVAVEWELNSSTIINIVLPADYSKLLHRGTQAVEEYKTTIVVTDDKGFEYTGVVVDAPLGDRLRVTAMGHSCLLKNMPWVGPQRSWVGVPASTVFSVVWANVTGRPRVPHMRLTGAQYVKGTLGAPATKQWRDQKQLFDAANAFVTKKENRVDYWERQAQTATGQLARALGSPYKAGKVTMGTSEPETKDASSYGIHIERRSANGTAKAVHYWRYSGVGSGRWSVWGNPTAMTAANRYITIQASLQRAKDLYPTYVTRADEAKEWLDKHEEQAGETYRLNEWSTRDLSETLKVMCENSNAHWFDSIAWANDKPVPVLNVDGTGGRRRDDLILELGVNVIAYPDKTKDIDRVATHVSVIGAGEGSATLMTTRANAGHRMVERWETVSDKNLDTAKSVGARADRVIREATNAGKPRYDRIEIIDHHLADVGGIRPGDWVYPVGRDKAGDRVDRWVQVAGVRRESGTRRVTLKLAE